MRIVLLSLLISACCPATESRPTVAIGDCFVLKTDLQYADFPERVYKIVSVGSKGFKAAVDTPPRFWHGPSRPFESSEISQFQFVKCEQN